MKTISIITPCYNEELNVQNCNDLLKAVFKKDLPGYRCEHIFSQIMPPRTELSPFFGAWQQEIRT